MQRRRLNLGTSLLITLSAAAPTLAATAIADLKIIEHSPEQGIVGLAGGQDAGVRVGDPFWLLSESGVVGGGEVFFVTPDKCAGRLAGDPQSVTAAQYAVVLKQQSLSDLRDRMPPGATVSGKIVRLPPGRHTAWIDLHAGSGLRLGDRVVVPRKGLLISRGQVKIIDDRTALVTLEPLVSNALPEPGDHVELWPAPADAQWGRLNTAVLAVTERPPGTLDPFELTIAGSADDGIAVDRLVDVYRGRRYVGCARVVAVSIPNSVARMPGAGDGATTTKPADGDTAIVRASPESPPGPLTVPVFKVDRDYCLVAAGELDGIREGETFLVRRQDPADPIVWHEVALLTVNKLAPAHCGAEIKPLTSQVAGVQVQDMAERQVPGVERWRPIGIVEQVDVASRTGLAAVEPGCEISPGAVVAWIPEREAPPGAAIVLQRETDRLVLHVPPGWGDIGLLHRSRIDASK